jgi:hypothetical protein
VAGRALVFSNAEVIRLSSKFVPYAGDQWYLHRQKDADGVFFWKVAQQGHNKDLPEDATRQGIYFAAPDGRLLGSDHFRPSAGAMVALMKTSLERWQPGSTAVPAGAPEKSLLRTPPVGGLILNEYSRIPIDTSAAGKWSANSAVGRDHVWLKREELRTLLPLHWKNGERYPVPPAVAERLVRFHLVDNVRGEPNMWAREHVRASEMTLVVEDAATGKLGLEGTARMQTQNPALRGYDARLQGVLVYDRKAAKFTRFDLVAWGEAWGHGSYTAGAPPGRFPLVIAFSRAGDKPADRVPPQAAREIDDYFGTGRQAAVPGLR